MIYTDTNTERQETQTVDRNSVGINTTMNTEEASTSTETVYVNKQTQTEAKTETKEDIRSVEIVKEDFSYNS